MGDDRVAIADGFIAVLKLGQLPARCILRIENMLVPETKLAQFQTRIDLLAIGIVVGAAK
jgi:hypothetical protein